MFRHLLRHGVSFIHHMPLSLPHLNFTCRHLFSCPFVCLVRVVSQKILPLPALLLSRSNLPSAIAHHLSSIPLHRAALFITTHAKARHHRLVHRPTARLPPESNSLLLHLNSHSARSGSLADVICRWLIPSVRGWISPTLSHRRECLAQSELFPRIITTFAWPSLHKVVALGSGVHCLTIIIH